MGQFGGVVVRVGLSRDELHPDDVLVGAWTEIEVRVRRLKQPDGADAGTRAKIGARIRTSRLRREFGELLRRRRVTLAVVGDEGLSNAGKTSRFGEVRELCSGSASRACRDLIREVKHGLPADLRRARMLHRFRCLPDFWLILFVGLFLGVVAGGSGTIRDRKYCRSSEPHGGDSGLSSRRINGGRGERGTVAPANSVPPVSLLRSMPLPIPPGLNDRLHAFSPVIAFVPIPVFGSYETLSACM